jgi:hypothetical protein
MGLNKRLIGAGAVGSGALTPSENFKAVIYTGNGSSQSITGLGFKPDLVWIKNRTTSGYEHFWWDSSRGAGGNKSINSDSTNAEGTENTAAYGYLSSFDTDGFTLTAGTSSSVTINKSGDSYVAWCWKANGGTTSSNTDGDITGAVQANKNAGFSIVTWTSSSSASDTIGHGLDSKPDAVLYKKRSATGSWFLYTDLYDGSWDELILNGYAAKDDFAGTYATSTTFKSVTSSSGANWISYCFHSVDGFSKFGTYAGNSSDNGPIVETGFEPAFLMIKNMTDAGSWFMYDNKRNTSNPRKNYLLANGTNVEASDMGGVDFLSNGFQIKEDHDDVNDTGDTYFYMAFAADPDTEAPTLASSFDIETYTGTSATQSISGLGFSPNLIWLKERSGTDRHVLIDTIRGANSQLSSNDSNAETTYSSNLESFDTNGFTLGSATETNGSGETYVGWTWKADDNEPTINDNGSTDSIVSANDNAGFSIIKYTGTGSNLTVGHGLSSAPTFMIVKNLTSSSAWAVFHTTLGATKYLALNETTAEATASNVWNDTAPTATTISVGTWGPVNTSANQHIAYCFHDVAGYSKFGSYTGTAGALTVTVGFKPDFVMIKRADSSANWVIIDSRRDSGDIRLYPNLSNAEDDGQGESFTSTGFKPRPSSTSDTNISGATYIYWAIAKNVPSNTTLASSFKAVTYTGNSTNDFGTTLTQSVTGVGFKPDLVWIKNRNHTYSHGLFDRVRGETHQVQSNSNAAQSSSDGYLKSFDSDGFGLGGDYAFNRNTYTYVAWCWKAGQTWQSNIDGSSPSTVNVNTANGFSIVKYIGNQTAGHTIGHGLGAVPEVIILKCLDSTNPWYVYHVGVDASNPAHYNLRLNESDARQDSTTEFNDTAPTSTVFTLGTTTGTNKTDNEYIAYCWTPKSGYSKFSSYSGTGSSNSITGLGFQPDWIMIKETDGTDSWEVYDSVRGDDKVLYPNGNNAEGTGSNFTSFDSDGFTVSSATSVNENGKTYIYMAFKMN